MDGQQSMAQAQQPSVKDKLLMGDQPQMPQGIQQGMPQMPQQPVMAAEGGMMYADGGIADLPAPNMESMDMASGGIVAFSGKDNDQQVEDEQARKDREALKYGFANTKAAIGDILTLPGRGIAGAFETAVTRPVRAMGINMPYLPSSFYGGDASSLTPYMDKLTKQRENKSTLPASTAAINRDADTQEGYTHGKDLNPPAPAKGPAAGAPPVVTPGAPKADKEKAGLGATDEFSSYMDMVKKNNADYLSKLEGLSTKQREGLAKLKSQGGGEALMNLAQGLLSKRGLAAGVAAGLPGVTATSAASRKEQRAVEQGANEMDFNLAKAQQAAAKGDMESALMFKKMADEAKYRTEYLGLQRAQLNKEPDMLRTLKGIAGNPQLEALYGKTGKADVLDREAAAKLWKDLSKSEKRTKYGDDFELYYTTMNNRLLSATIPGQGANVIGSIK
jgi:hypothetical protein